jgi:hypothetical protein
MYDLACHLGKNNTEMLWLAIVGLTDQLVHDRIDYKAYKREVQFFKVQEAAVSFYLVSNYAYKQRSQKKLALNNRVYQTDSLIHASYMLKSIL